MKLSIKELSKEIYYMWLANADPSSSDFYKKIDHVEAIYYWYFRWNFDSLITVNDWEREFLNEKVTLLDRFDVSRLCVLMIEGESKKKIVGMSESELFYWMGWYYCTFQSSDYQEFICDFEVNMLVRPFDEVNQLVMINYIRFIFEYRSEYREMFNNLKTNEQDLYFVYGWLLHVLENEDSIIVENIIGRLKSFFLSDCSASKFGGMPAAVLFRSIFDGLSLNECAAMGEAEISDRMSAYLCPDNKLISCSHGYLLTGGVTLVGMVSGVLGIGEDVRQTYKALEKIGVKCSAFSFPEKISSRRIDDYTIGKIKSYLVYNKIIINLTGHEIVRLYSAYGNALFDERYVIGYIPLELGVWPDELIDVLDLVDEVWCPSDFIKKAIENRTNKPVVTIGLAMECSDHDHNWDMDFGEHVNKYKVLLMFDAFSYVDRKAPMDAIRAFNEAFCNQNDAVLIVKTMNIELIEKEYIELKEECIVNDKIIFIDEVFDRSKTLTLIDSIDCLLSLHRSEGFGRIIAETMYYGKDVIVSDYSGNKDFCNDETALLVSGSEVEIHENEYPFYKNQVWFQADIDDAAKKLQYAYQNRTDELSIHRRDIAKSTVIEKYSHESMGKKMSDRLNEIERDNRKLNTKVPFDAKFYTTYYPDLDKLGEGELIEHYVRFGCDEGRAASSFDLNIINKYNNNYLGVKKNKKICVSIHSYYREMIPLLSGYIKNLSQYDYDVFVNVPETVADDDHLEAIETYFDPKKILISPNSGRDVAGMIRIGKEIDGEDYDLCLVLHTKCSPQNRGEYVEKWSQDLLRPILGTRRSVQYIINKMRLNLDEWGAAAALQWKSVCLNDNSKFVNEFFDRFKISNNNRVLEYVSGTMMFLDVKVLKILSEEFGFNDFETCHSKGEDFFFDGQIEHAVERIIGAIIKNNNQKIMWVE